MNHRHIFFVVCVSVLLITSGASVASGHHTSTIFDWVDDVAGDDDNYGLSDPYSLFSGDEESLIDANDPYNSTNDAFDEDATIETFYRVGDYTSKGPEEDVLTWNANNRFDFDTGGEQKSIFPMDTVEKSDFKDGEKGHLKDAYVQFYAADPSTRVHYEPENSGEERTDRTEYRVGTNTNLYVIHGARTTDPDFGLLDGVLDKQKRVSVETYGVKSTKLYSDNCGTADECLLAEQSNTDDHVKFDNVQFEDVGPTTLRVESTYTVQYNVSTYLRDWVCDPVRVPWSDSDGDGRLEQGTRGERPTEGGESEGWSCQWTDWEYKSSATTVDTVSVEDQLIVTVAEPEVEAIQATFPNGDVGYHFTGLDRGEWSEISFIEGTTEEPGLKSGWRFFSARDQRWDRVCEYDGKAGLINPDHCPGTVFSDANHHEEASGRPVLTHAIPSPTGVTSLSPNTNIVSVPVSMSYVYPYVENSPTCRNSCNWRFLLYEAIEPGVDTYEDPEELIVSRPTAADEVRVYGLTAGESKEVDVTTKRDIHTARIYYTEKFQGSDLPDNVRQDSSSALDLPEEGEVRVEVTLYDAATGDPINLKERDGEYISISDGTSTYQMKPGADGTVAFNARITQSTYRVTYHTTPWWDVPADQQAFVTEGAKYLDPGNPYTPTSALEVIFNVGIVILLPFVVMQYMARVFGIQLKRSHFLWLFKGK